MQLPAKANQSSKVEETYQKSIVCTIKNSKNMEKKVIWKTRVEWKNEFFKEQSHTALKRAKTSEIHKDLNFSRKWKQYKEYITKIKEWFQMYDNHENIVFLKRWFTPNTQEWKTP